MLFIRRFSVMGVIGVMGGGWWVVGLEGASGLDLPAVLFDRIERGELNEKFDIYR